MIEVKEKTFANATNSKKKGDIGLGVAIGYFTEKGYTVSIPLTDSQDYDLIVDIPNEGVKRVQIKTTEFKTKHGVYNINLSVKGGNRSFNTIKKFDWKCSDYLFVYTSDKRKFFIPTWENMPKGGMNLGKDKEQFLV